MRHTTFTESLDQVIDSGVNGVTTERPKSIFENMSITDGEHTTWDAIAKTGNMAFAPLKEAMPHPHFSKHAYAAIDALRKGDEDLHAHHFIQMGKFKTTPAFATLRDDNFGFLGAVGEGYTPIPHSRGFELIDSVIKSVDGAHYKDAGVINGGAVVWGVADMNTVIEVKGTEDATELGLLFTTSHDASSKFTIQVITNRIWCGNALALELSKEAKRSFSITHTKNFEDRIEEARVVAAGFLEKVEEHSQWANELAHRAIPSTKVLNEIMLDLFKVRKAENSEETQVKTRTFLSINAITDLFKDADDGLAAKTSGSAWNLFNGITRWIDHEKNPRITKRRKAQGMTPTHARSESAAFGDGAKFKAHAMGVMNDWLTKLPRQIIQ